MDRRSGGGRRARNGDTETVNPVHASVAEQTLAQITNLRAAVVDMKAMQEKLGTKKDTTSLRERLKKRRAEAKAADKAIRGLVGKLKKVSGLMARARSLCCDALWVVTVASLLQRVTRCVVPRVARGDAQSRTSKTKIQRILKDLVTVAEAYKKVAKATELKERQFLAQASARQLHGACATWCISRGGGGLTCTGTAVYFPTTTAVDANQMEEGKADRGRRQDSAGDLATGLQGVNFQILTDVDLHIMREREEEAEAIARVRGYVGSTRRSPPDRLPVGVLQCMSLCRCTNAVHSGRFCGPGCRRLARRDSGPGDFGGPARRVHQRDGEERKQCQEERRRWYRALRSGEWAGGGDVRAPSAVAWLDGGGRANVARGSCAGHRPPKSVPQEAVVRAWLRYIDCGCHLGAHAHQANVAACAALSWHFHVRRSSPS